MFTVPKKQEAGTALGSPREALELVKRRRERGTVGKRLSCDFLERTQEPGPGVVRAGGQRPRM